MDQIFENKPVAQLEAADSRIQTYVLLLEKKLKSCMTMNNLNKEIERKLFVTLDELNTLKLQNKQNCHNDEQQQVDVDVDELKNDNTLIHNENKELKEQITILQNQLLQLNIALITKAPPAVSNYADNKDPNANSVLIKGFAEYQLNTISKISIIHLGRVMNLEVMDKDIVNVSKMERKYYERHNLKPNKVILIVQLRTPEIKIEFLKNKEKLKTMSHYKEIEISDYVSDEVYNLYQYAKILKSCGYAQIYWRNNCVYAKKTRSTYCAPIPIRTKADVDQLKI